MRRDIVGYEIVERFDDVNGVVAAITLWEGDYRRARIIDRANNRPVTKRHIASVYPNASGRGSYTYKLHCGAQGGWRYGYATNYETALKAVDRWVRRRLAVRVK